MAKTQSHGKCHLCNQTFSKAAMSRHLAKCVEAHAASGKGVSRSPPKTEKLFHLVAEGQGAPMYWLHLEVPARATLEDLDIFLRNIWLECCGHMSAFRIGEESYSVAPDPDWGDEQGMDVELGEVFEPGMKFSYEYDFGSTTELALKVVGEREGTASKKEPVRLLARNDPPEVLCGVCKKAPATIIDVENSWEPTGWLCEACAEKQGVDEEMTLPVVNSPRAGVCAYTGA
jgi:hypothetical protein